MLYLVGHVRGVWHRWFPLPLPGPQPDWDPDIVAGLDEDFDYENPANQLEDDFMEFANAEGGWVSGIRSKLSTEKSVGWKNSKYESISIMKNRWLMLYNYYDTTKNMMPWIIIRGWLLFNGNRFALFQRWRSDCFRRSRLVGWRRGRLGLRQPGRTELRERGDSVAVHGVLDDIVRDEEKWRTDPTRWQIRTGAAFVWFLSHRWFWDWF